MVLWLGAWLWITASQSLLCHFLAVGEFVKFSVSKFPNSKKKEAFFIGIGKIGSILHVNCLEQSLAYGQVSTNLSNSDYLSLPVTCFYLLSCPEAH